MKATGEPLEIKKSADHIFNFLNDFTNFEHLMPEQINNWKADKDSCSFEINNMATIELRIAERVPAQMLKMVSEGKSPFPIQLVSNLQNKGGELCAFHFEITAEANPMISMMVKKPLQNLVNIMGERLKEFMEKQG